MFMIAQSRRFKLRQNQCIEHLQLLGHVHRLSRGLIAIAQINTASRGSLFQRVVGPLPVGQVKWWGTDGTYERECATAGAARP
jgi:hypothetical protein